MKLISSLRIEISPRPSSPPGSINEKLQTMFYMYDIDGTGYMSQKQIGQMFR